MKTPEQKLQKLLDKAKELNKEDKISIPKENLTEVSLEDIFNAKGKIYLKEKIIYRELRKKSGEWLFFKMGVKESKIEELEKRIKVLEDWTWEFKKYIDEKILEKKC